jgi:Pvc16 N-terminal domain/Carboxypeptidase regulatory-like domain
VIRVVDALLRGLLVGSVKGIDAVEQVGFAPPDGVWQTAVNGGGNEALNVYLIEVRENRQLRSNARRRVSSGGWVGEVRAPGRADCHYLVSAWSPAQQAQPAVAPTEDEHGLLYDAAAVLMDATPLNPARIPGPVPPDPPWDGEFGPYYSVDMPTRVLPVEGFPKYAEFWGSMGQGRPWRPVVQVVVTVPVVSREPAVTGPPVTTLRTVLHGEDRAAEQVAFAIGGTVRDAAGVPVERAWIALEGPGSARLRRTVADADGRFRFTEVRAGHYVVRAAAAGHAAVSLAVTVPAPSGGYEITFT